MKNMKKILGLILIIALAVVLCVGIIMMILRVKTFGISDSLFIVLKWLIITVCVIVS